MERIISLCHHERDLLRKFKIDKQVRIRLLGLNPLQNDNTSNTELHELVEAESGKATEIAKEVINSHQSAPAETKSFKCGKCNFSAKIQSKLNQHLKTHSAERPFKCLQCCYQAKYKKVLQSHVTSQHNENPESRTRNFPCQLCSKSFYTKSSLHTHSSTHTKVKPFSCHFCSRSFAKKGDKNFHESVCKRNPKQSNEAYAESLKKYVCDLCNIKVRTKSNLANHMRTHTLERPYKCDKCDYAGISAAVLMIHTTRRHNPNRTKIISCALCPKMFYTEPELRRHIFTHTLEKPWKCEFCNKQFSHCSEKRRHQKICKLNPKQNDKTWVEKQKIFKCELCKYSSAQKYRIKRHLITHTGEKPFKCSLCEYTCSEFNMLNTHIRTHTGERPSKCPHCPYSAARNTDLQKHIFRRHNLMK